jgi:hypothetical protein
MRIGDIASAVGKGLIAGAIGTIALTATQLLAQRLLDEEESTAAADAAEKLVGIMPRGESGKTRLNYLTHFSYGAAWGVPRALMELFGLRGWRADAAHFAAVQAGAASMLPALDLAPPPTEWPKKQIGLETLYHAVYAGTTGVALGFMDRRSERAQLAA